LPQGLFLYEPPSHALRITMAGDPRRLIGYKDFVGTGALDLLYVAAFSQSDLPTAGPRDAFAFAASGAMAQNVHLYCASAGLGTVIRSWFDRDALAVAFGLATDHQPLLAQTVGVVENTS